MKAGHLHHELDGHGTGSHNFELGQDNDEEIDEETGARKSSDSAIPTSASNLSAADRLGSKSDSELSIDDLEYLPPMIDDWEHHHMGDTIKPQGLDVDAKVIENDGMEYLFLIDQDVASLKMNLGRPLYVHYRKALCNFTVGQWDQASVALRECLRIDPDDGPSRAMLEYCLFLNYLELP